MEYFENLPISVPLRVIFFFFCCTDYRHVILFTDYLLMNFGTLELAFIKQIP